MPREGFEPTIPVFERLNTVRALDRAAIGTDPFNFRCFKKVLLDGNCCTHGTDLKLH